MKSLYSYCLKEAFIIIKNKYLLIASSAIIGLTLVGCSSSLSSFTETYDLNVGDGYEASATFKASNDAEKALIEGFKDENLSYLKENINNFKYVEGSSKMIQYIDSTPEDWTVLSKEEIAISLQSFVESHFPNDIELPSYTTTVSKDDTGGYTVELKEVTQTLIIPSNENDGNNGLFTSTVDYQRAAEDPNAEYREDVDRTIIKYNSEFEITSFKNETYYGDPSDVSLDFAFEAE